MRLASGGSELHNKTVEAYDSLCVYIQKEVLWEIVMEYH